MSLHEECGVFGVFTPNTEDVANIVYFGLYALQHRGQESCGIVVNNHGQFQSYKNLGLLNEVFTPSVLSRFSAGKYGSGACSIWNNWWLPTEIIASLLR